MRDSDDPWERESRHDRQHSMPPEGYPARDAGRARPQPSLWRSLRHWLFNVLPLALSLGSVLLMLYLLAKLAGLR